MKSKEKSSEQIEYERLSNFLKYTVSFSIGAITVVSAFVFALTYKDMHEYKAEYKEAVIGLKKELQEVKEKSLNTILDTEQKTNSVLVTLSDEANIQIKSVRTDAQYIALNEAKRKVNESLQTPAISKIIKEEATNVIRDEVNELTKEQISIELEKQLEIQKWAMSFSSGNFEALRKYWYMEFKNLEPLQKQALNKYYHEISSSYNNQSIRESFRVNETNINSFFSEIENNSTNEIIVGKIKQKINSQVNLNDLCFSLKVLGNFEGKNSHCFEDLRVFKPF